MKESEYRDILKGLKKSGDISEETFDQMEDMAVYFCDELEDWDERFPRSYCEIEYSDMESEEAVMGCRFDDMNFLRYFER